MTLGEQMRQVVSEIRERAKAGMDHYDICFGCATLFELWEPDGTFPVWLSRVVEGDHAPATRAESNWSDED